MPLCDYPFKGTPTTKAPVDEACDGTLHLITSFNVELFPVWQYSRNCCKECPVYKASLHDFNKEHQVFYKPLYFRPLHNPDGNPQTEVVDLTGDTEDQDKITTNRGFVGSDEHVQRERFFRIYVPINDDTDKAKCSVEAEETAEVRGSARSVNSATSDEVDGGATVTESDEAERPTGASASGDRPEDGGAAVDELELETNRLQHNSGTNSFVHAATQTTVSNQPTIVTNSPNSVKRYQRPSTGRRPLRVVGRVIENLFAGRYRHHFLRHRQQQRRRKKVVGSDNSSTTVTVTNGASSHGPSSNTINTQGGSNNASSTYTSIPNVSQNGSGPGVTNGASHAPNSNTTDTQGDSSNSGCCPIMPMHMTIPMVKTFTNTIVITDDTYPSVTVTVGNTHVSTTVSENGSRPTVTTNDGHLSTAMIRNDSSPNTTVTRSGGGQVASITKNNSGPTSTITRSDCGPRATLTRNDSGISATITRSDSGSSVITTKGNSNPSVITNYESGSSTIISKNISGMSTTIKKNSNVQNATITGNRNDQSTTIPITYFTGKVGSSNATTATNRCVQTGENDRTSEQQRATITENGSGQSAIVTGNGSGSSTNSTRNDNFPITSFGVCATNSAVGKKCNSSINSRSDNVMTSTKSKNGSCTALQRSDSELSSTNCRSTRVTNANTLKISNNRSSDKSKGHTVVLTNSSCGKGSSASGATNSAIKRNCNTSINSRSECVISSTPSKNGSCTSMPTSDSGQSSTNCRSASVTNAYKRNILNNTVSDNSKGSNVAPTNRRYGNGNFTIENIMASPKEYYSKREPISDGCSTITGTVSSEGKTDSNRTNSASSNNNVDENTKKLRSLSAIRNSGTYESDTSGCGGVGGFNDDDDDEDAVTDHNEDDAATVVDLENVIDTDTVVDDDEDNNDDDDDDDDDDAVTDPNEDDAVTVVDLENVIDTDTVVDDDEDEDNNNDDDDDDEDEEDDDDDDDDDEEDVNEAVGDSDCDDEDVGDGSDHNGHDNDDKGESNVCSNKDTLIKGITNSVQSLVDYESNDTSDSSGSFNERNDTSEGEDNTSTNRSGCNNDNDVSSHSNGRNKRNSTSVMDNVAKRIKLESAANLDFHRMQDARIIDYIDLTNE